MPSNSAKTATPLSRRSFLRASGLAVAAAALPGRAQSPGAAQTSETAPLPIGSRLELFIDDALVGSLAGAADRRLRHPAPQEVSMVHNTPWEGGGSAYHNIFQDGDIYRMYYRGWQLDGADPRLNAHGNLNPTQCCYAESKDGIRWRRPNLGLFDSGGSRANNIVIPAAYPGFAKLSVGETSVFKDENPAAASDARYKTITWSKIPFGLISFKSPDGIYWKPLSAKPIITEGSFDSQNLAFWDGERGEYRAYWRYFTRGVTNEKEWKTGGTRAIRTATSKDFLHWSPGENLRYVDSPEEQLYTSQIKPYHRAPHILIGFPTRYSDRGWSASMRALPEWEFRQLRARSSPRYGSAVTEGLLMASRDRVTFKRWNEAFLRDGIERDGTWNYGNQYIGWHLVETKSPLGGGAPNELSLYAPERYWRADGSVLRRYTLRMDGFVSISAPMAGGEFLTKPLTFTGRRLALNFSSSAAGGIRVEIQDPSGRAFPGFTLGDCHSIFGDSLQRPVTWKGGGDVSALEGKPVRLRFALNDADLYALRFS